MIKSPLLLHRLLPEWWRLLHLLRRRWFWRLAPPARSSAGDVSINVCWHPTFRRRSRLSSPLLIESLVPAISSKCYRYLFHPNVNTDKINISTFLIVLGASKSIIWCLVLIDLFFSSIYSLFLFFFCFFSFCSHVRFFK